MPFSSLTFFECSENHLSFSPPYFSISIALAVNQLDFRVQARHLAAV